MGLLGAHVSISGGMDKAIDRGQALECQAIQIFSKNQRRWNHKELLPEQVEEFHKRLKSSGIRKTLIHASYLINLATPDPVHLKRSRENLVEEVKRAALLRASALVLHPGSHKGSGEEDGIDRIVQSLELVMDHSTEWDGYLLVENTSGGGSQCGSRIEFLARIVQQTCLNGRIGICYDTAHGFAAGYDLRTRTGYENVFKQFDTLIGLENLYAFHINDAASELGSRKDKHQNTGDGFLGENPFRWLVNDTRFANIPMILETPGGETQFAKNLELLRSYTEHEGDHNGIN